METEHESVGEEAVGELSEPAEGSDAQDEPSGNAEEPTEAEGGDDGPDEIDAARRERDRFEARLPEPAGPPTAGESRSEPDPEPELAQRPGLQGYDVPPAVEARPRPRLRSIERNPEPEPRVFGEPGELPAGERAFRIVELRQLTDGGVDAQVRYELTTKVYKRVTAQRFTAYQAKRLPPDEALFVLLSPAGAGIGVYASGTGRPVSGRVGRRARKMVRELLPKVTGAKRSRRTSRQPRNRRTSRGRRRRTSRGR